MLRPSHSPWIIHSNNIWWRVQWWNSSLILSILLLTAPHVQMFCSGSFSLTHWIYVLLRWETKLYTHKNWSKILVLYFTFSDKSRGNKIILHWMRHQSVDTVCCFFV
jgi:hypothetical protein